MSQVAKNCETHRIHEVSAQETDLEYIKRLEVDVKYFEKRLDMRSLDPDRFFRDYLTGLIKELKRELKTEREEFEARYVPTSISVHRRTGKNPS